MKTKNKGDRNHLLEVEDIQHRTFELPLLVCRQGKSVDATNDCVGEDEDDEVNVD